MDDSVDVDDWASDGVWSEAGVGVGGFDDIIVDDN